MRPSTKPIDRFLRRLAVATGGPASWADPLSGLPSLAGRTCLVTGATSGHGEAVAHGLARLGADLVIHGRSPDRCARVQQAIATETGRRPEVLRCDLSSLAEVKAAAKRYLVDGGWPLHLLVNNAGLVNLARRVSADGFELTFAVNYLAHFTLTNLLLPRLTKSGTAARPARIVNVSSDTHRIVSLELEDLQAERRYSLMGAYGRSKLALVYLTLELAERLRRSGGPVRINAVDPGPVESGIGSNHAGLAPRALAHLMRWTFPSAERASRTALRLCADPTLSPVSGGYFKFERQRQPRVEDGVGQRLWRRSLDLAGLHDAAANIPG